MRNYPARHGRTVYRAETVDDYTIEGAKAASQNCPNCYGSGFAFIYNPAYQGQAVILELDDRDGLRQVLMRSTAFCICPAGRKTAVLNQQSSKDFFLRTPDLHDVIAGRHRDWIADDPTYDPNAILDVQALPESLRRLAGTLRLPRVYRELEES